MSGIIGDNTARASGVIASAGGGTILSVKSLEVTGTSSNSGTSPTQISAFDMSFAPTTSDGKLYFQCCLSIGVSGSADAGGYFYDVTNTTIIGAYGDAAGSRLRTSWGVFTGNGAYPNTVSFGTWHEPGSTDSRNYTIFGNANLSTTLYINRTGDYTNDSSIRNAVRGSTFTITEYAADTVTLT